MPRAVFRADSSADIGIGHIMRCLTLADALNASGWRCEFIHKAHSGRADSLIRSRGYECHLIALQEGRDECATNHGRWLGGSQIKDAETVSRYLREAKTDVLIVDHYGIDATWETHCKALVGKLLVIDDLADRRHDCDLLLDQTLGRTESDYQNCIPDGARSLLGTDYALLRPQFARLRQLKGERSIPDTISTILVTMGGTDPDNTTEKVMRAMAPVVERYPVNITVVMGETAVHLARVIDTAKSLGHRVLTAVEDMAKLMSESDLAIGAAGSTAWERCCMGLPTLMFVTALNQKTIARHLESTGAAMNFDEVNAASMKKLVDTLQHYLQYPNELEQFIRAAEQSCDGLGAERVVACLQEGFENE